MSLDDLEKKLYDPDSGVEKREHESSQFDPTVSQKENSEIFKKEKDWGTPNSIKKEEKIKMMKIGGIVLGSIALATFLVIGFVKFRQAAFSEKRVIVKIEGPLKINSSTESKYKISFKNDNRAELRNAKLTLNYSENFKPKENQYLKIENPSNSRINIGTIKSREEKEFEISGSFFAAKDTTIYLNAILEYTPSNFNSIFVSKGQLGVKVDSSPLFLEIQAPSEVVSGNKVDYVIDYRNLSSEYFDGVKLKIDYPEGFSFVSSQPSPSEGSGIWYLGSMNPNQSGKLVVSGTINGENGENKLVKVYLGYTGENGEFVIFDQKERPTKMTSTILSISQLINERTDLNVNAGEVLRWKIKYKNNGNIALKDAIITLEVDSRILDYSRIEMSKGFYDASRKMITWKAAEISELANLAPGQSGEVTFSIPVLSRIPVENSNDKNFTIVSTAKIDSPSIPTPIGSNKVVASNRMELKLNSKIVLDIKGYHKDTNISNLGSIPPKVGQETTYVIHWKIINISNDIANTKVTSFIPSGVKWTGKIYPEGESIIFNERTNQIEWNIGNLESGVGIIEPEKEVSFQISVTPQINQIGEPLTLLNPSILTANDLFTGSELRVETREKDNRLQEDPTVGDNFKVIQ